MMELLTALVLVLGVALANARSCSEGQILCPDDYHCISLGQICDGSRDCDYTGFDENYSLCEAWKQEGCERGFAKCHRNGSAECVTMSSYCTLSDPPCQGCVDSRICQMLSNEWLSTFDGVVVSGRRVKTQVQLSQELGEEFRAQVDGTIRDREDQCPMMYTRVAGTCVSIFYFGNITWGEAREFCKTIDGDLLTLHGEYSFYAKLVKHIRDQQLTADFWVGGSKFNDTTNWVWVDDVPMDLNSVIWSLRHDETCMTRQVHSLAFNCTKKLRLANEGQCYWYTKAPADPPRGYCAALTYESYHQMTEEDCLSRKAPLCVSKTS